MLDLFSGLGGASKVFRERGWKVIRVDIDDQHNTLFEPTIVADICSWKPTPDLVGEIDFLWASPPCTEFSKYSLPWWRKKSHPEPSMACIDAVRSLVREIRPRFWILENVRGAHRWLGPCRQAAGSFHLWGEFPRMKNPPKCLKGIVIRSGCSIHPDPRLSANIPRELSQAVCDAIESELAQAVQS
jgi:hypothetical protein